MKIYDPTCGSWNAYTNKKFSKKNGRSFEFMLSGQEMNLSTWAICKLNMFFTEFVEQILERGHSWIHNILRMVTYEI